MPVTYEPRVEPQLTVTGHQSAVNLQLITCVTLKIADESDLLLFTDFLRDYCSKHAINLVKINAFEQYYLCNKKLVYLSHAVAVTYCSMEGHFIVLLCHFNHWHYVMITCHTAANSKCP